MISGTVKIRNKLEVLPGNFLVVPQCEPTSAFSSTTLAENRECKTTVVTLKDALEAIPDATLEMLPNIFPKRFLFVLPSGPPPNPDCPCRRPKDFYEILRQIGRTVELPKTIQQIDTSKPISTVLSVDLRRIRDTDPGGFPERPTSVGQICEAFPLRGIF